ncbi:MAG: SHOCT-like domain-containing protein [Acholeplasmataceae bacterium]
MSKDALKEERMKILDMLQKGIVSPEEAEKLLSALERADSDDEVVTPMKKTPFRMLKIYIDSNDGDVVKVQIPIEFAKLLKTDKFRSNLKGADIDIDAILEMINQGAVGDLVNIQSGDGDVIRVVVE